MPHLVAEMLSPSKITEIEFPVNDNIETNDVELNKEDRNDPPFDLLLNEDSEVLPKSNAKNIGKFVSEYTYVYLEIMLQIRGMIGILAN